MVKLNKKIIIAIDGGPGTGKSTVSDYIAKKLNIVHIDTGAMFRAVGYFFVKNNIELSEENVVSNLDKIDIRLEYKELKTLVFLNNEDVKNSYFGMMAIASNLDLSKYNLKLSAPIEKMVEQKQEQKGFETSIA